MNPTLNYQPINLKQFLLNLNNHTKNSLQDQLSDIHSHSHFYHIHWKNLCLPSVDNSSEDNPSEDNPSTDNQTEENSSSSSSSSRLLDLLFELLKKYEINGLQLNGLGCWLFERFIVLTKCPLSQSLKYSDEIIIEVILRILLEHSIPLVCISILNEIIVQNPNEKLKLISSIGKCLFLCLPLSLSSSS